MIAATVRTQRSAAPQQPPTLYLNTLPGDQFSAALRLAPDGVRATSTSPRARCWGAQRVGDPRSARRAFLVGATAR